jgi:hypothetical protein
MVSSWTDSVRRATTTGHDRSELDPAGIHASARHDCCPGLVVLVIALQSLDLLTHCRAGLQQQAPQVRDRPGEGCVSTVRNSRSARVSLVVWVSGVRGHRRHGSRTAGHRSDPRHRWSARPSGPVRPVTLDGRAHSRQPSGPAGHPQPPTARAGSGVAEVACRTRRIPCSIAAPTVPPGLGLRVAQQAAPPSNVPVGEFVEPVISQTAVAI